jgi:hypothetical protein
MRSLIKKISAAISLTFYLLGMMIEAMSIFWAMNVQLPYNLTPVEGTLISLGISLVFFLLQKKLYDDDGAPGQSLVTAFDSLSDVIWNRFTTDKKCIGKIHLVSPYVTVDNGCLNIRVGQQTIRWCRTTNEISCIDLSTGNITHLRSRILWRAYRHLMDAFDNMSKVHWD